MDARSTRDQAGLSRRALLTLAASAGALGALGLLAANRWGQWDYPLPDKAQLNGRMQASLLALARIWLPPADGDFPAPESVDMLASIDASLALLPASLREQVGAALQAFELGALVYGWHGAPFSFLPADEARAYVQRWGDGHAAQRSLILALRQLILLAYWRHPETWPATGYAGPLHQRLSMPALGDAPEPART